MRKSILLTALVFTAGAALAACGSSTPTDPSTTIPLKFTTTVTVPTTTVAAPTTTTYQGPNGLPIETGAFLGQAATTALGAPVDGIDCQTVQQLAYRAFTHLQVYVRGQSRALPGGIGMVDPTVSDTNRGLAYSAKTCFYWLHTRAADGLIEVESPVAQTFTLADLFAIWDQPLRHNRVAGAHGKVTAIVNGRRWHGKVGSIPLREHEVIELALGQPVPKFHKLDWSGTGL